jgi:hypothetical protein
VYRRMELLLGPHHVFRTLFLSVELNSDLGPSLVWESQPFQQAGEPAVTPEWVEEWLDRQ